MALQRDSDGGRPSGTTAILDLLKYVRQIRRYDRDRPRYIEERRRRSGNTFYLHDTDLVVADGRLAKKILAETYRRTFLTDTLYLSRTQGVEVLEQKAEDWRPARRALYHGILDLGMAEVALTATATLDAYLASLWGTRVALADRLQFASGLIMCELALGDRAPSIPGLLSRLVDANLRLTNSSYLLPAWLPSRTVRSQRRLSLEMATHLHNVAATVRASPADRQHCLAESLTGHNELTTAQIVSALRVSLLASFGVPGVATAWALLALKRRPELEHAARVEAEGVVVSATLVEDAPVLAAIAKEVLRLYPPAWMLSRTATDTCEVDDITIRRGTTMNIALYSIHRDSSHWRQAARFDPERWLQPTDNGEASYLPFGWGPGRCIGERIGLLLIVAMLRGFLLGYDLDQVSIDARPTVRGLLVPTRFDGRVVFRAAA